MADLPVVITSAGLQPQSPAAVQANLISRVAAIVPGYTADLPGSLIEDISSTDTIAIIECDSARVGAVNSLTPAGANQFLLLQLGEMLGVRQGEQSNTSVYVVFESDPGFVIGSGFLVSDGTFQYRVINGGIVGDDGETLPLFCVATLAGTWSVPAGTVTRLITSVPEGRIVECVNREPGIPGADTETEASFRARVLQANLAASQGMARYLRTLLTRVPGVQPRLVQPIQQPGGGWEIVVGGGDPYQVAYAIYTALFDISTLVGSDLFVAGITAALPAVVTTFLNHGLLVDADINIAGASPVGYNGDFVVMTIPSEKTFSIGKRFLLNNIVAQSWAGGTITWTTTTPHGVTVGSTFTIIGSLPSGYSGTFTAIAATTGSTLKATAADPGASTVLGQLQPGVALFDSSGLGAWVSGGVVTPNPRNLVVSINDYPDAFQIPIVLPPQQDVTMTVNWDTTSPNFVAEAAIAQLAGPAIVDYINSITVGSPINVLQLEDAFQQAVLALLPPDLISVLDFDVAINGIGTAVSPGTHLIVGDAESFFFAVVSGIAFNRV